jgi:hypothetical protein
MSIALLLFFVLCSKLHGLFEFPLHLLLLQ